MTEEIWNKIDDNTPEDIWLRTKRFDEVGENVCFMRRLRYNSTVPDDAEWIERFTGRTTVTHQSFLPPTHWLPLK